MCDENVLQDIYTFLKALLKAEFKYICQKIINDDTFNVKDKKKKLRKKTISIVTGLSEEKIDETMSEDDNEVETVEEIIVTPIKKTKKERKTKAKLDIIDDNIEIIEEA
jgi:phosphopantothenoylcysteine synthetase/decarboxylase